MKKLILFIQLAFISGVLYAQTASDILENGVRIKKDQAIFLEFDPIKKVLKYDLSKAIGDSSNPLKTDEFDDSTIFSIDGGVQVYLLPFNPLMYSFTDTVATYVDPIGEELSGGLNAILAVLHTLDTESIAEATEVGGSDIMNILSLHDQEPSDLCDSTLNFAKTSVIEISKKLKEDQNKSIAKIFSFLKSMTFSTEDVTISQLSKSKSEISLLESNLDQIKTSIKLLEDTIKTYSCEPCSSCEMNFVIKHVFKQIVDELKIELTGKQKRLDNMNVAFKKCESLQKKATLGGGQPGLTWCIRLPDINLSKKEINKLTIRISSDELTLSDKNEIVTKNKKELVSRTVYFRNYNLFVPEVSAGIVFTTFSYNTFATTTDSTGRSFVGAPTRDFKDNLNISTMMNFNFLIPNSYVHPLIQLGAGINNGIPTLLTGGGLRFNIGDKRKLAVSSGLAWTWIQELNTLSVGQEVDGQSAIDNDLKYSFSWAPKAYLGIQINL